MARTILGAMSTGGSDCSGSRSEWEQEIVNFKLSRERKGILKQGDSCWLFKRTHLNMDTEYK